MKKRSVQMLALFLLAVLLVGCASEGPSETKATTVPDQMAGTFPGLGGVMPEMSFTTADGETMKLSDLLKEKELVVLNFWFENCGWCMREFPVMELAYQRYREDVEIIALNPVDGARAVSAFQAKSSLSFPMAACPRSWAVEIGVTVYPTSVFIDRDGVICLLYAGAITGSEDWYTLFETFTADDYERKIYNSISDLAS